MATLERVGADKPEIVRGMGGTASLTPLAGTGPTGPAGPGASNSDVAGYVGTAGLTKTALDLAYTKARRRDIQTFAGCTPDGSDITAAVQAAFDTHVPIVFTPGSSFYSIRGAILLDQWDFEVAKGAVVRKDFAGGGTYSTAMFRNRDMTTDIEGGYVSVEGFLRTLDQTVQGNFLSFRCNDLRIPSMHIDVFGDNCRAISLSGDRIKLGGDWDIRGGPVVAGSAAVRFLGGTGFRTEPGGYLESADDCFQFVPPGATSDPNYGRDIIDCWYIGWTGVAHVGKLMTCGLQTATAPDGDVMMTTSILRSGWINCGGKGKAASARAANYSSKGAVDAYVINCFPDATDSGSNSSEYQAIRAVPTGIVGGGATAGDTLGTSRLTVRGGHVFDPNKSAASTIGDATLRLIDTDLPKGRTASAATVNIPSGQLILRGGSYDGGGVANRDTIQLGAAAADLFSQSTNTARNIVTGGNLVVSIDGGANQTIALATADTLVAVVTKINAVLGASATATRFAATGTTGRLEIQSATTGFASSVLIVSGTGSVLADLDLSAGQLVTGEAAHDSIIDPTEVTGIGQNGAGVLIKAGTTNTRVIGRGRYSKYGSVTGTKGVEIEAGALGVRVAPGADYANVSTAVSNGEATAVVPANTTTGFAAVAFTGSPDDQADGTTNHVFTAADDTKLGGIATGATANSSDATLLARANHTGTQAAGTITGLGGAATLNVGTGSGTVAAGDDSRFSVQTLAYTTHSGSATIAGASYTHDTDATGGAVTLTLPTAAGITGRCYVVRKNDASANTVTVACNGAETINGAATFVISTRYEAVTVQSDGTNWMVI